MFIIHIITVGCVFMLGYNTALLIEEMKNNYGLPKPKSKNVNVAMKKHIKKGLKK